MGLGKGCERFEGGGGGDGVVVDYFYFFGGGGRKGSDVGGGWALELGLWGLWWWKVVGVRVLVGGLIAAGFIDLPFGHRLRCLLPHLLILLKSHRIGIVHGKLLLGPLGLTIIHLLLLPSSGLDWLGITHGNGNSQLRRFLRIMADNTFAYNRREGVICEGAGLGMLGLWLGLLGLGGALEVYALHHGFYVEGGLLLLWLLGVLVLELRLRRLRLEVVDYWLRFYFGGWVYADLVV